MAAAVMLRVMADVMIIRSRCRHIWGRRRIPDNLDTLSEFINIYPQLPVRHIQIVLYTCPLIYIIIYIAFYTPAANPFPC